MSQRLPSARDGSAHGCVGRLAGFGGLLLAIAVIVVVCWGFTVGLDALLVAPWGYPLFGRPTLAGYWVSTFTTPSGIHFALYLRLSVHAMKAAAC